MNRFLSSVSGIQRHARFGVRGGSVSRFNFRQRKRPLGLIILGAFLVSIQLFYELLT